MGSRSRPRSLIFVLFAASLHLLAAVGGIVSFGHAAYFGLGAYGAALAMQAGWACRWSRRSLAGAAAGAAGALRLRLVLRCG